MRVDKFLNEVPHLHRRALAEAHNLLDLLRTFDMCFDILRSLILLEIVEYFFFCFAFHLIFHPDNCHGGFFDAGLNIMLHASPSCFVRRVTILLAVLIRLVFTMMDPIGLFDRLSDLLFMIIPLDKIMNCLLPSSESRLLLEVVASRRNLRNKPWIIQLKHSWPPSRHKDVMVGLTASDLGAKSVTVVHHELAILIVHLLQKQLSNKIDTSSHQSLRQWQ